MEHSRGWVAEVNGESECLVITDPGILRHQDEDLSCSCITGVTTSRVVRRQGLRVGSWRRRSLKTPRQGSWFPHWGCSSRVITTSSDSQRPIRVSVLFDPAAIKVYTKPRIPKRLGLDNWEAVYTSRTRRFRSHGAVSVLNPHHVKADMMGLTTCLVSGIRKTESGRISSAGTRRMWKTGRI